MGSRYNLVYLLCGLLFLSACTEYNRITHRQDVILYPLEKELEMGSKVAQRFLQKYPPVEDTDLQERINRMGQRLAQVCDRRDLHYQFIVVDFPGKNAVSLPGGYIFISKELVDFCRSDDEIASVLAHEIGHIVSKHGIKRLQASYLALVGTIGVVASKNPNLARGVQGALAVLFSAYSREDEFTADELGAKYMRRAGYDVKAMVDLFARMDEVHTYEEPASKVPSYLRTHPFLGERIHRIKAKFMGSAPDDFLSYVSQELD